MPGAGRLYVIEGPDGVGKSTLARAFHERLLNAGVESELMAFPGRESGTLGLHVYQLHHQPQQFGIGSIDPTSLQILHIAAHINAIEQRISPTLKAGVTIVLDRYWWSAWVYGLASGVPRGPLQAMIDLERQHWKHILPDCIFFVHRDQPYRHELDLVRFERINSLYAELASQPGSEAVYTITNSGTVPQEVSRMMALVQGPRNRPANAGSTDHV